MIRSTFFIIIVYAISVIMLGILGFQAGSNVSLIVSSLFGILIITFSILAAYLKNNWPVFFILIAVVALLSFFIYRFATTRHFMPAAMSLFSGLTAALTSVWLASRKKI